MIKALTPEQTFRMPASYLRRQYAILASVATAATLMMVAFGPMSLMRGAGTLGLLSMALLLIYPLLRLRPWVTISGAGIQGRRILGGRRTLVAWSEPVSLVEHTPYRGAAGVRVFRFNGRGQRRKIHSLFIPYPILRDGRFRETLARIAPSNHPLKAW